MLETVVYLTYGVEVETPHFGTMLLGFKKHPEESGFDFCMARLMQSDVDLSFIQPNPGKHHMYQKLSLSVPVVIAWDGTKYPLEDAVEQLYTLTIDRAYATDSVEHEQINTNHMALQQRIVTRVLKQLIFEQQVAEEFVA